MGPGDISITASGISANQRIQMVQEAFDAQRQRAREMMFQAEFSAVPSNPTTTNMSNREDIEVVMKGRHLRKPERDALHQPQSDWEQTGRGETCKSASTLEIKDILIKHKVVAS